MLRRKCKIFYLVNVYNTNHCLSPSIQWPQVLGARRRMFGVAGEDDTQNHHYHPEKSKRSSQLEFTVMFLAKCPLKHCREFYRHRGGTEEIQTNQWIPTVRDKQFQMLHTRIALQPNSLPRWRLGRLLSGYFQLQCFMKTQYALMRKTSVYMGSSSSSRKHRGKY